MRAPVVILVAALALLGAVFGPAAATQDETTAAGVDHPCAGRVAAPANGVTLVSVQGARMGANGSKTAARLLAFGPYGELEWVYHGGRNHGLVWSYDVDPLPSGTVFVTATRPGRTVLFELDPETGERRWTETLPLEDTHDADVLNGERIVIANMRNHDEANGTSNDRIAVYNRTSGEYEWEWRFADHYDREIGGNYTEDWTHVNDVDAVGEDAFLASPRNFDQVILINRSTGEIDLRLGRDDRFRVLHEQHNPDYLEGEDGTPTFLVGDSENDRVVEYKKGSSGWVRSWTAGTSTTLSWPRDADRLPNGNTLIADSQNNRAIEVAPSGEVVWEVYGPWLVYDVERVAAGDGSNGPTMADQGTTGTTELDHASPPSAAELERCDAHIAAFRGGFGVDDGPSNPTPILGQAQGRPGPSPTGVVVSVLAVVGGALFIRLLSR